MTSSLLAYGSIPIVSAVIGWLTNLVAVRMIFRPRKPFRLLGLEIVGLVPKRRSELARKIGETVERELISHRDIQNLINTPLFHEEVNGLLGKKIDEFINNNLRSNPLIGMFLSATVTGTIRDVLAKEIQKMIPDAMEQMFKRVELKLDFKEIVRQRIEEFDLQKLEEIIYGIAARELRAIEWYGGVLGFAVGLLQAGIVIILNHRF